MLPLRKRNRTSHSVHPERQQTQSLYNTLLYLLYSPLFNFIMFPKPKKSVTLQDPSEQTPLFVDRAQSHSSEEMDGTGHFEELKQDSVRHTDNDSIKKQMMAADRLSMRLLQVDDDDSDAEDLILKESLDISIHGGRRGSLDVLSNMQEAARQAARERLFTMIGLLVLVFGLIIAALWVGVEFIGPPNQPVGPYELVERQVREVSVCNYKNVSVNFKFLS